MGETRSFDVIVIGLGGMGSAAAQHLAFLGRRVLGLDRFPPLHDRGSSHGASRIIRQAYFESTNYVPLLLRAYELWERTERDSGVPLLTITGGVMIGSPESDVVRGSMASARLHGLSHELLDASTLRRRFPPFTPRPEEVAVFEPRAGIVHPERALTALRSLAAASGAVLRFEEPALSWSADGGGVTVTTTRGAYAADRLVLSAGPWMPQLLKGLALPLTVERQVLFWFEPRGGTAAFDPAGFPIWIWETAPGLQLYGFPAQDGRVKAAFYHAGTAVTADEVDRVVRPEEVRQIREVLASRVPALDVAAADAKTCLYTSTPDYDFVLGLHPDHPNVVIASPCSGHGFKFVPVIGEILAELAIEGASRHPIDSFSPRRFL